MRKKITYLFILFFLFLASRTAAQTPIYILDFTDTSTFSYDCGKVNPPLWEVSNDSCTLETSTFNLSDTCGVLTDIPFSITLNQSGNLECDDRAYFWYYCDTAWFPLDTIDGCLTTFVITFYYYVPCPAGSAFAIKVSFHTNHNTEKWQLRNNDIKIYNPCPTTLEAAVTKISARNVNERVQVAWSTEQQLPPDALFEVERSFDNEGFEKVGEIMYGQEIPGDPEFRFYDTKVPNKKTVYYRIRTIMPQGMSYISSIATLHQDKSNIFSAAYPVPAKDQLFVDINIPSNGLYSLALMDIMGKVVMEKSYNLPKGQHQMELNVSNIASGMYFLMMNNGQEQEAMKLNVRR